MSICVTASKIMKAKDVVKEARNMLENGTLLMVAELEIKREYHRRKTIA